MEINEKLNFIEQIKRTMEILKTGGVAVKMLMNIKDKIYFAIQKVLHINRNNTQMLTEGIKTSNTRKESNYRKELYQPELTAQTNAVAMEYINKLTNENNKPAPEKEKVR